MLRSSEPFPLPDPRFALTDPLFTVMFRNLDRQVESGMMKLVEEKKALNEISTLKKSRKAFDTFTAQQAAIDADKAKIDAIRAGMDNPEAKAISDKFNALRSELDTINKAHDQSSKGRDALYEEKNA